MKKKISARKYFWGRCRSILEKIIPETSFAYKIIYLNAVKFQARKRNKRKDKLFFQTSIVDSCNLNCASCYVFSPLCDGGFVDLNSFDKDIKQIGILTNGEVEKIVLMGGEPLLHPYIKVIFEITRKYIKIGEIAIITNGILLLKQDVSFWESCKDNKVKIYITPYPIKLDYEQIIKIAEGYSVDVEYFYVGNKSSFRKLPLNIKGEKDIIENFKRCTSSNTCVALRNGKMYGCQTIAYIDYFNSYFGQDFKVSEKDYVDIHNATSVDEILDFMCKPMPFCRYCDVDAMKFGIKWDISKKEIGEWT